MVTHRMNFGGARRVTALLLVALALAGAFATWRMTRAAQAGVDGKDALVDAQRSLARSDAGKARKDLRRAEAAFKRMGAQLDGLGPLGPVLRTIPLVRVQMRGAEAFRRSGTLLT